MTKRFLHNEFFVEQLEPRLLFSADTAFMPIDAAAIYAEGMVDFSVVEASLVPGAASTDLQAADEQQRHEVLFVNSNVQDYEQLVNDILANGNDGLQIDVVVLDSSRDGIEQISETLNRYEDIDALHIISHGTNGAVQLGSTSLSLDTVGDYAESIAGWQDALSKEADLLFYGCDLAAGEDGKLLIDNLNTLTGADVAASEDLTGNALLGGDWILEYNSGNIETGVALSADIQKSWACVLGSIAVTTTDDVVSGDADTSSLANLFTTPGSDGLISLREAIIAANTDTTPGMDTITLSAGTYTLTIAGTGEDASSTGDLDITDDLTITGSSASSTVIDAIGLTPKDRVVHAIGGDIYMSDLTIQNGDAGGDEGGGIFAPSGGATGLTLTNVIVTGNTANHGGGIRSSVTTTLTDVEVSGNTASFFGGGIRTDISLTWDGGTLSGNNATNGGGIANISPFGSMDLTNVTISGNTATSTGGGVYNEKTATLTNLTITNNTANNGGGIRKSGGATTTVTNTIIAGNISPGDVDVSGAINSLGYNLIGDSAGGSGYDAADILDVSPTLGPLADNGGFTQSHALLTGSRGIDEGTTTGAPATDQRGQARGFDGNGTPNNPQPGDYDIGAYELVSSATISGTVYTDEGVTTIADGKTIRLFVNGVDAGTDTTSGGAYSITVANLNSGDSLLVYIDNDGTYKGTTVTVSDSTDLSDLDIYDGHVITRHDNSGALSDADMDNALGGSSDTDILYSGNLINITIANDVDLYIPIGHSLTPLGDITTQGTGGHLDLHGTYIFTATDNLTVSGDLNISDDGRMDASGTASGILTVSGNWNDHIGTTNFISVADLQLEYNFNGISKSISSDESYYYAHFTGDSTLINSDITIADQLRIEPGASLAQNATTITMNGNNYFISGTYTHDSSSVLEVNGSINLVSNKNYPNITINNGGSVASGNPSTIDYDLTIESGGSLNVVNRLDVGGDWINNGGTLNTSGIVAFIGSGSQIGGTATTAFDRLIIGDGAGDSVTSINDITVSNVMSINAGASFTVADGKNITNSNDLTIDGTMNLGGTTTWYIEDKKVVQVNSGGLLNVQGTDAANQVTITHNAGTGFYDMLIDGGMDFNYVNIFYSQSADQVSKGFQIRSPGVETMSFDNVAFNYTEDVGNAVMLTYDTARSLNASNISFDSSTYASTSDYNVQALSGTITINGYSGNYAGEADDYDNGGTAIWSQLTTIGDGTAPADRNVWAGGYQFGVNSFTLSTDAGTDTLTDLTVTFSGDDVNDVRSTGVGGVSIWRDDGLTPDQWDINDTQIGTTVSFVGNTASFAGLGESINTTATQYLVTYNIDGNATTGNTLQGAVTAATVSNALIIGDNDDATLTVEAGYVHETSVYKFVYGPGIGNELYLKNSSSPTTNILNGMSIGSLYSGGPGSLLITFDPDATVTTIVNNSTVEQVQMTGRLMDSAGNSYGTVIADMTFYEDRVVFDMNVSVTSDPSGVDWLFMSYGTFSGAMDPNFLYSGNSNPFSNQTATYTVSGQSEPISYQTLFELGATDGLVNATLQHDGSFASAGLKNIDNTGSYDVAFQKDISGAPIGNYNSSVMYSFATTTTGLDATLAEEVRDGYFVPATLDFTIPGNDGINLGYVPERGAYTLQDDDDAGEDDHVQFEFQPTTTHHKPVFEISSWDTLVPSIITVDGVTKILGTDYTAALEGTTLYIQYLGDVSANSVFEIGNDFVSGTLYSDEGVTEIAGKTVRLLVNGVDAGTGTTDANGRFSIFTNIFANDTLLVYVDDNLAGTDGTTVTVNDGNGLAGMDIYVDHLITRHDNGGAMTNALMDTADGAGGDTEILYSVAGGNLTISGANTELYIPGSHTFVPGGDVSTHDIEILGTVTAGANTFTVSGNWTNNDTFTAGTSTVTFDGGNQSINGSTTFYNFTKVDSTNNATDVTLTFDNTATQTINGTLTLDGLDADDRINLVSDSPTNQWSINLTASATKGTMDYLDVTDSDASGSDASHITFDPANSIDGGNNIDWFDTTAPVVTVNVVTTNDTTPELTGTVDDPASTININIDGNNYAATNNGDGTWTLADNTIAALAEGVYEVVATATDTVGNAGVDGTNNEVDIDLTAPTITITSINTNDTTPGLSGTIDDTTATININIDGNNYAATNNGDGTWTLADNTIAALAEGVYEVVATATDTVGNAGVDGTNNEVDIDLTAPTITITSINTNDTTPGLSGTIDDTTATININIDGNNYAATNNGDGTWTLADNTIAALAEGVYEVIATATDTVGNAGVDGTNNEVDIDLTAPTITITSINTNDTTPGLSGTIDDTTATININIDGNNYAATNNGDGTWTLADNTIAALAEGVYEVVATATDTVGNAGVDGTNNEVDIDLTAPTITITSINTNDTTPGLSGTIDDTTATININIDGNNYAATNNGDGTWTLADNTIAALAEGVYEVIATATDTVGNAGVDGTNNEVDIDLTAPTITITSINTNDTTPGLSGTIDDTTATININIDGNNYAATNNGDGTWTLADNTIAALAEGVYEVIATATDTVGNAGVDGSTNEVDIDLTAPTITITSINTNDTTPGLSGTIDDTTATININIDGNNYAATNNGDGTWTLADNTIAALAEGVYEVVATATDTVGNAGVDGTNNEVDIDLTAPTITITSINTNDTTPGLSGTIDDTTATININIDGNNYAATNNGDGTWTLADNTIAALAEGVYEVVATATDTVGNAGVDGTNNEVDIDLTAPTITITSINTNDTTPGLSGTIDDTTATININIDGNNYAATNNGDGTWTLADNTIAALAEGVYEVIATATDTVGNAGVDGTNNEVDIDLTAPTITITSINTNDTTPGLSGTIDDTTATININIDGNNYAATNNGDGTWTLADNTIAALAEGVYEVVATATDTVGNAGVDGTNNEVDIDLTAPTITITSINTNDTTPGLSGTIDDTTATININIDGNNYAATNNGDGTWTLADNTIAALAEGVYEVIATATDTVGNAGVDGTNNEVDIDLTAPTITITSINTNDTTPGLSGTIDDTTATININIDGNNYAATNNGDGTWTLADNTIAALAEGVYEVVATATDTVGNAGVDGTNNEVDIDLTAPTITITSINTNDTTPGLSGTIDDTTATININIDGNNYAATNNGDGTWTLADNTIAALAEGVYEVIATATDTVGNAGVDGTNNEVDIDLTAPTITITSINTNDTTPGLSGTIDDTTATININIDGNNYAATNNGDGTWTLADNTIAALAEGVYEVVATATDTVGNAGVDGSTNEVDIDLTAPTITITSINTNDTTPQLTGTVNDTAATIQVTVNGNTYAATNNGDGTWTLADNTIAPALADGVWEVAVTATDAASNVGSDATANELTVNANDAPTATNMNATESYTLDTPLNLIDIVVSDIDSANVTVTLTLSDVSAGSLSTGTSGAVTSTFVGGVWTASGAIADVNTLIASVTFSPALNYNSNFTIATSVDDGIAPAITGMKNIVITSSGGGSTEDPPPTDETDDENIDENIVDEPAIENDLQEGEPAPSNPQPLMSVRNKSVSKTKPDLASASSQAIEDRDDYGAMHSQEKDHALIKIIKEKIQNLIQYKQELLTSMEMTRDSIESIERKSHLITKTIVGGTLTLSVGLATWVLRAGSLVTSALSTMPLWKGFDPLPVLPLSTKERRKKIKEIHASEKEENINNKEVSEMLDSPKMQNVKNGKEEDES